MNGIHAWRWRLLTVWIVAFTVVVGLILAQHHDQTMRAERLAAESRRTNDRQEASIVMLCNRGYIILGLVESALRLARAQKNRDMHAAPRFVLAELAFIHNFGQAHAQIVDQLTDKHSPCVAAAG